MRSPRAQFSSARSSASIANLSGGRQLARATLDRHAVADRKDALGGQHHRVILGQQQARRRQRIAAQAAQRDQQVVAGAAMQPWQHEPLIDALEALLGRPARVREQRQLLASGALGKADVGVERLRRAGGLVAAAWPENRRPGAPGSCGQGVAIASIAANGWSLSSGPR